MFHKMQKKQLQHQIIYFVTIFLLVSYFWNTEKAINIQNNKKQNTHVIKLQVHKLGVKKHSQA